MATLGRTNRTRDEQNNAEEGDAGANDIDGEMEQSS